MKKCLFFVLCSLFLSAPCCASICSMKMNNAHDKYVKENKGKQLDANKASTEELKREYQIRNFCYGASTTWHSSCAYGKCLGVQDSEKVFLYKLGDACKWSEIDCFTDDVEKIYSILMESKDSVFTMFFTDMDSIVNDISNSNANIGLIDTDKTVCYRSNSDGNTIWHAFVKSKKSLKEWASLCASQLKDNNAEIVTSAMYATKNDNGKTAFEEARLNGDDSIGYFIGWLAKENGQSCDALAKDIADNNDISVDDAKKSIHYCN